MSTELSPRDMALLKMAADGKSGQEMQAETGLSAAFAVLRVKELLRERDIWSEIERRQLLMQELYSLKVKLQKQNEEYINDKQAMVLLQTIQTIDNVMDKQGKITDEQLMKITQAQAHAMMSMIQAAFEHAKGLLAQENPGLDLQEIESAFNEGLVAQMTQYE